MRKKTKKLLTLSLATMQLVTAFPVAAIPVFAEEVKQEQTQGSSEAITTEDKVTKEDLPVEVVEKLTEVEGESEPKSESDPEQQETVEEVEETAEIQEANPTIIEEFGKTEVSQLEELKASAAEKGLSESVDDREETSKTFIDPETGDGETIIFTRPIHEKDKDGNWQEKTDELIEQPEVIENHGDTPVSIPKSLDEADQVSVASGKSSINFGLPKEKYQATGIQGNSILLASDHANEPAEITVKDGKVELKQYIDSETDLSKLKFSLAIPEGKKAKFEEDKGIIGIYEGKEMTDVIPMPMLQSLSDGVITTLGHEYDQEESTITIKGIDPEIVKEVGSAKVTLAVVPQKVIVTGVTSTSIRQYDDKKSYEFQPYMMVGYDDGYSSGDDGAAHFQSYGILNVPNDKIKAISKDNEIMSATLKMKRIGEQGFWGDRAKDGNGKVVTRTFEAAGLTKDVGGYNSLTYDKFIRQLGSPYGPPAHDDGKETKFAGLDPNNRWVDFDITNLANDWKNGSDNHGLILKNNKMSSHEMPYAQAELFGGKGFANAEPYVVLEHRVKPPIDKNMPLDQTTLKLRPFVRSDNDGLIQFAALGLDGIGRPDAQITYRIKDQNDNDKVTYTGTEPSIGRDYLYPNYPLVIKDAQRYLELSSNWQTKDLLTTILKENHLYQSEATITYTKGDKNEKAEKSYDKFQLYKVSSQDTLARLLAFYGLEKNRASFMRDNNMKDELLTQGNIVFIRNPKKNAGKAYTPKPLTNAEKIRIDSLAMGRGKHCQFNFEPLNIGSGNFLYEMTDATWYDNDQEESFTRTYNAMGQGQDGPVGRNWSLNQMISLNQLADKSMMLSLSDGGKVFFTRKEDGSYEVEDALPYELSKVMETVDETEKRTFVLKDTKEKLTYVFDATGQIRSITNSNGHKKNYSYNEETGFLKETTLFNGKKIQYKWDDEAHLTEITFPDGSKNTFSYNKSGDLTKVVDALGKKFTYSYDDQHRMTSYAGDDGKTIYANEYDKEDRVIKQTDASGGVVTLSYGKNTTTTVDGNGNQTITTFNDHYQPTKVEYADGTVESSKYNKDYQLLETVDRKGQKTSYTYDQKGNLTQTTFPDGTTETTTYNEWSQPLVETDRQGHSTTHAYDDKGNEISLTDQKGQTTNYEYNGNGERVKEIDPLGHETFFDYQEGNLTGKRDAAGTLFTYSYDAKGLLTQETDGLGNSRSFTRNSRGDLVKETNFNGQEKQYSYDAEGNKTSESDFNGNKTTYTYNAIGQLAAETNAAGAKKTYKYDHNGNLIAESDYLGNLQTTKFNSLNERTKIEFPDGATATYKYDVLGNLIKEKLPSGNTIEYTYDSNNFVAAEVDGDGNTTAYERTPYGLPTKITYPDKTTEEFTYDQVGNVLTEKGRNGNVITYSYDGKNQPITIKNGDRVTSKVYDARGNEIQTTDPLGHTTQVNYDLGGFVTETIEADGAKTAYVNDGEGNPLKITDAKGAVYQFVYDGNGNTLKELTPDGKETLFTYTKMDLLETEVKANGDILQYKYDANGNLTKRIDPMGAETKYSYTATNEIKQMTDALGNKSIFAYDKGGNLTKFTDAIGRATTYDYNALDQLIKETTPMGVETNYSYDGMNNLTKVKDSTKQSESYTYNALGQILSVTDSQGRKELYEYNQYGELTKETDIAGNSTTYEYDAVGNLTKTKTPQGTTESGSYDSRGQLTEITKHNGGKARYEYDAVGNVVKEINDGNGAKTYAYDVLGQLKEVVDENGGKSNFSYDALGRVIESKDANGHISKQQYDGNDQVIKETDAEGNSTTYKYDALGQLLESVDAQGFKQTFSYDAAGRQLTGSDLKGNVTTYSYDAANNVLEVVDALKRKTSYTYDLRNQLTKVVDAEKAATTYSYHQDGNLAKETDAKGYETTYAYDEFSQVTEVKDNVHQKPLLGYTYDKFGQVVKETRSGEQETSYVYDKTGRMSSLTYPNQTTIGYEYDTMDRVSKMVDIRGNATGFVYDGLGNLKEMVAPNDARTKYEYDKNNNLIKETDPLDFATTFAYNKNDQVVATTDANGGKSSQSYDKRGFVSSITSARGHKQKFEYDGNGNQAKQEDAKGNEQTFVYDAGDRLTKTTNRLGKATNYRYDKQDNLTTIQDANGGETLLEYSPVGELESLTSADGKKETYSYRLDGQLTKNTKADGATIAYSYDELNRMVGKQMKNQDFVYEYDASDLLTKATVTTKLDLATIDNQAVRDNIPEGHTLTLERNKFGDLTKAISNENEEIGYAYDTLGRRTEVLYPNGSKASYAYDKRNQLTTVTDASGETKYTHDGNGQITKIAYGDGSVTEYTYLATGEIRSAKTVDSAGAEVAKQDYSYDENGNLTKETLVYPKFTLTRNFEYDKEDQLIKTTEVEGKTTRVSEYLYDNVGNRIGVLQSVNGKSKGASEWKHNGDNQLLEITGESGATYEYNENGHVSKKQSATGEVTTYAYDAEGRLFHEATNYGKQTFYYYDALGNRITKATATDKDLPDRSTTLMEWIKATDREGLLTASSTNLTLAEALEAGKNPTCVDCKKKCQKPWRIDHNATDGNRREAQTEKLKKALDKNHVVEMIHYLNDHTQEFVSPLQMTSSTYEDKKKTTRTATLYYDDAGTAIGDDLDSYHQDGLGSNSAQTQRTDGTLYAANLYSDFGESERRIADQAGYRSQYHDTATVQHLRARQYDTATGRFLQQDTVIGDQRNPVTQNKYMYGNNNPFMYRDDAGRWAWLSKKVKQVKKAAKKAFKKVVNFFKPIVNVVKKAATAAWNTVKSVFTGGGNKSSGSYKKYTAYSNNFIGPLPKNSYRVNSNTSYSTYNLAKPGMNYSSRNYGMNYSSFGGKSYNMDNPSERASYYRKVTAAESRKRGEARLKKMCDVLDQLLKGSYSEHSTALGTASEMLAGGIPGIGDIADIRDMVHGFQTKNPAEVAAAGMGLIPLFGGFAKEGAQAIIKESAQSAAKEGAQSAAKEAVQGAGKEVAGANQKVLEEISRRSKFYKAETGFDCSEIAEDLYRVSGEKGKIYEITSDTGWIKGKEYGEVKEFSYHQVYSDGKYIYDPRFNDAPMLESDYFKAIRKLNPNGINIK